MTLLTDGQYCCDDVPSHRVMKFGIFVGLGEGLGNQPLDLAMCICLHLGDGSTHRSEPQE